MTAEDVITQARELDPAFTAERHPRRVAVNFLSRLQRRLVGAWAKLEETQEVEVFTVSFPLTDFAAGVLLQDDAESVGVPLKITAVHRPLDIYIQGQDLPDDLELVRWGDRNRKGAERAAYIREDTLFFTGVERLYNDVTSVEFTYTPTPADIATLDEELVLPDTAEEAVVSWLGAFFARRSNEKELARPRREYLVEAQDAEALWLDEIRRREGATVSRTRVVW